MRLLLYEMRLAPTESVHLVDAIQTRLEAVEIRAGIDATLDVLTPEIWPQAWEEELLPIVMEGLNNSLKHASASRVRVQLAGGHNWLELSIRDNGRGFSTPATSAAGIGLHSMRERAERLGGTLRIDAIPGAGTALSIHIGTPTASQIPAHADPVQTELSVR
jgi:signal transduction histidine kinase